MYKTSTYSEWHAEQGEMNWFRTKWTTVASERYNIIVALCGPPFTLYKTCGGHTHWGSVSSQRKNNRTGKLLSFWSGLLFHHSYTKYLTHKATQVVAHTATAHTSPHPAPLKACPLTTDPPKFHNNPQYREVCNWSKMASLFGGLSWTVSSITLIFSIQSPTLRVWGLSYRFG